MLFRHLAVALLPVLALAQTPPASTPGAPPDVDKALRARVSQFFQYHVDGEFRKAYNLVAEDTKEEYFNSAKLKLISFEIVDIKYSNDFKQAEVNVTATMPWTIQLQPNISVVPMITTWKIEDGKWVWYHHLQTGAALTPMGPSRIDPKINGPNSGLKIPEHIDADAVTGAAANILKQITVDKSLVNLPVDKASSEKIVVHNGTQGFIQLSMAAGSDIPGFKATLDKTQIGANQDAVLTLQYDPVNSEPHTPFQIRLLAAPFNQLFTVTVNLGQTAGN